MPGSSSVEDRSRNNQAISAIFMQMADCYRYLGKEERFRALAYENVAKSIHNMKEDISLYADDKPSLDAMKGIGESIADKIIEYLKTGTVKTFEELKKKVPFALLELMHINGIGPATLKTLHDELGITDKESLVKALQTNKLDGLKGFGQKKIENMQRALKLYKETARMPLKDAERTGNELLRDIKKIPGVQNADLAGSLRRKKETIGDIDIVIQAEPNNRKKIIAELIRLPQVKQVLVKGPTKTSVLLSGRNIQVDCRLVNRDEYGAALLYFTGSKEHNIKLRTLAKDKGYKINEYGLFDNKTQKKMAGTTEEEMYRFLNLAYIPPERRLNKGEIENAVMQKPSRHAEPV